MREMGGSVRAGREFPGSQKRDPGHPAEVVSGETRGTRLRWFPVRSGVAALVVFGEVWVVLAPASRERPWGAVQRKLFGGMGDVGASGFFDFAQNDSIKSG